MVECRRLGRGFPKTALILHDRAHYVGLRSSPPHGVQEPCTGPEPAGPLPRILWAALPTNRPGMVLNLLGESLARHGACDSSAGSVDRDVTAPYLACRRALCGARPLGALSGREHCRSPLPDPWWSRSRSTQRLFRKRCADLQLLAGECDRGLPARGAGAGGGCLLPGRPRMPRLRLLSHPTFAPSTSRYQDTFALPFLDSGST